MAKKKAEEFETFVRNMLTDLNTKIDNVIEGQNKMDTRVENLEKVVAENKTDLEEIKESLEFQDKKVEDIETNQNSLKSTSDQHTKDIDILKATIAKLEGETNSLERYTRTFNLRFLNIPEEADENCRDTLATLFSDHLAITGDLIENAHRTGMKRETGPRHVIARFHSRVDRNRVIRAARTADPKPPFMAMDDLTPPDLAEKNRLGPLMKHLHGDGKRPRFHAGRLFSNGRALSTLEINTLMNTLPNDG